MIIKIIVGILVISSVVFGNLKKIPSFKEYLGVSRINNDTLLTLKIIFKLILSILIVWISLLVSTFLYMAFVQAHDIASKTNPKGIGISRGGLTLCYIAFWILIIIILYLIWKKKKRINYGESDNEND